MVDRVTPFPLRVGHANADLRRVQRYAAEQSYSSLHDNHSAEEAAGFVAMAVGHIEGAVKYLSEVGKLDHASDIVGRLSRLYIDRDPEKVSNRISADVMRNLYMGLLLSGKPAAMLAAEALVQAAGFFLRLQGASDRARAAINVALTNTTDGVRQ